jgi:hypothetical protein
LDKKNSLVLITTATNPPEGVFVLEMTNVATRKITAKAGVFFWAASGVSNIVIADATGQILLDQSEVLALKQMGVEVEQIHYLQDNDSVLSKGKGYGEGALIKFAMQNSALLKQADSFFKCTGKVYCRNFPEILHMIEQNNIKNIIWRDVFGNVADTRFFYSSKEFGENFLIAAYENIDDKNGICSEHCVWKIANEHLTQRTSIRPLLSGFSGSLNQPYFDKGMGFLDENFPCWISQ